MSSSTSGLILPYNGQHPLLADDVFLAPGTVVIGDVHIGQGSSIWFNSVVRGDVDQIRIGQRVNVQDLSMIHVTGGKHPTIIDDDVTLGHRVIIHGCHIEARCLIGMGTIVMDGAVVAEGSIVGAGAVVTPGTHIPPGTLALGAPARPKRPLTDKESQALLDSASRYALYASSYLRQGIGVLPSPLSEPPKRQGDQHDDL